MSSRFNNVPSASASKSDEETVAALVAMLSGMGIDRTRIAAMINKTARPEKISRSLPNASNANAVRSAEDPRRLA